MPDLEMYRGNDRVFELTVTRDNKPVNLTGASLRFVARGSVKADSLALVTKTTANGGILITDAVNGQVQISVDSVDTADLYAPTALHYDVELEEANGRISTAAKGVLLVQSTIEPV